MTSHTARYDIVQSEQKAFLTHQHADTEEVPVKLIYNTSLHMFSAVTALLNRALTQLTHATDTSELIKTHLE